MHQAVKNQRIRKLRLDNLIGLYAVAERMLTGGESYVHQPIKFGMADRADS